MMSRPARMAFLLIFRAYSLHEEDDFGGSGYIRICPGESYGNHRRRFRRFWAYPHHGEPPWRRLRCRFWAYSHHGERLPCRFWAYPYRLFWAFACHKRDSGHVVTMKMPVAGFHGMDMPRTWRAAFLVVGECPESCGIMHDGHQHSWCRGVPRIVRGIMTGIGGDSRCMARRVRLGC